LPTPRPTRGDLAVNRALRSAGSKAKRHNVEYRRAIGPPAPRLWNLKVLLFLVLRGFTRSLLKERDAGDCESDPYFNC
jgi:hypothetical protein